MYDVIYYLAGASMVGTIGFGLLYIFDRDTNSFFPKMGQAP